jgi:hypothetical protein
MSRISQEIEHDKKRRALMVQLTDLKVENDIQTKQAHNWQRIDLKNLYNREHEKYGVRELKKQIRLIQKSCIAK